MKEKTKKIRLAKKWIDALRSGEYRQGHGQLIKGDRYCCLGVLCDVAKQEFGLEIEKDLVSYEEEGYEDFPPFIVSETLGLNYPYGEYKIKNQLVILNDGDMDCKNKKSFKTIAKFLEDNLLPLLEQED